MTVLVAIRIPSVGAVLAADGRASDAGGRIVTDTCVKIAVLGSCVVGVCGADGRALQDLAEGGARKYGDIVEYVRGRASVEATWGLIVYDRGADRLLTLDSDLGEYEYETVATAGCGGQVAAGALAAMRTPGNLEAAARSCLRATKLACTLNSACGGRIRTIVVDGKRKPIQIG